MDKLTALDISDEFRSLSVLLCAVKEMDYRKEDESTVALEIIDAVLLRCRSLHQKLECQGVSRD